MRISRQRSLKQETADEPAGVIGGGNLAKKMIAWEREAGYICAYSREEGQILSISGPYI
jgi:hypothetical protein